MADASIDLKLNIDTDEARRKIEELRGRQSLLSRAISALQGKTTGWLAAFFVSGNVLHWCHRLDATYITFFTTFMGFALGHSIKEDWFEKKNGQ